MQKEDPHPGGNRRTLQVIVFVLILVSSVLVEYMWGERASTSAASEIAAEMAGGQGNAPGAIEAKVHSLFEREPLEWDIGTIRSILGWVAALPGQVPELIRLAATKSVLLILLGSGVLTLLIVSLFYGIFGWKKVFGRIQGAMGPLFDRTPKSLHILINLIARSFSASALPLLALAVAYLTGQFMALGGPWFRLTCNLLGLWAAGSLAIHLLRELLAGDTLPFYPIYGRQIFLILRIVLIYVLLAAGLTQVAEAVELHKDVLAFLRFAAGLSIVLVLFLLFLKKESFLSLMPDLPNRSFKLFAAFVERFYYPLILLSLAVGILMCLGYTNFARAFFIRTWVAALVYVGGMSAYHFIMNSLHGWARQKAEDETAQYFFRSARSLFRYTAILVGALALLSLFGLFEPLVDAMSFTIFAVGDASITLLLIVKAAIILVAFIYVSRLLRTYLDYKFYPTMGVETGVAYALNTFVKYAFIITGLLFALRIMGIDLRVLMVLAGSVGIGIGFGLKNIAANLIGGLILIFGRQLRKGDWVQVGDTVGVVSDIAFRATRVRTRDHIEYIIPNTEFIDKMVVNYTLTTPFVRVHVPVSVSYDADPNEVTRVLMECSEKEPGVSTYRRPAVWFAALGTSAISFELLVWTDIRQYSQKGMRSRLNFRIFEALRDAGIEISPPHDIRILPSMAALASAVRIDGERGDESSLAHREEGDVH